MCGLAHGFGIFLRWCGCGFWSLRFGCGAIAVERSEAEFIGVMEPVFQTSADVFVHAKSRERVAALHEEARLETGPYVRIRKRNKNCAGESLLGLVAQFEGLI